MPMISVLKRMKQDDHCDFKVILVYTVRLCVKGDKELGSWVYNTSTGNMEEGRSMEIVRQ